MWKTKYDKAVSSLEQIQKSIETNQRIPYPEQPLTNTTSSDNIRSSQESSQSTDEETKELFEIIQSSEKTVNDLKLKLADQSKDYRNRMQEMEKQHELDELYRRRLENEVTDLRQKLELETTVKNALQLNNREIDKEIKQLHRILQVRVGNGPPWVPDWYVVACTGCGIVFNLFIRKVFDSQNFEI